MVRLKTWPYCGVDRLADNFHTKINEYFHWCKDNKQDPILDFYPEGYDLNHNKAWPFIEHCMKLYDLQPTIITADWHANYECKIIKCHNHWMQSVPTLSNNSLKNIQTKFGHFVGRITWDRLMMHKFLIETPQDVLYTFWSSVHRADFVMRALKKIYNMYGFNSLKDYHDIIMRLPTTNFAPNIDNKHLISYPENTLGLQSVYRTIFCDIVHETDVNDSNCFYTEKTVRPMLFKTPFITMHGKGSLQSLKTLGFKTFDQWWPETYDNYHGKQRLEEILKCVKLIKSLSMSDVQKIAKEMEDVLQHNYAHLTSRKWQNKMYRLGIKFYREDTNEF